mmetsp:Transcript_31339/g.78592  ORF Transcript_31339/g.78592 Transcript_31339/m.78592 type:complete len:259 (-) Transcript_31339:702-1478(-)
MLWRIFASDVSAFATRRFVPQKDPEDPYPETADPDSRLDPPPVSGELVPVPLPLEWRSRAARIAFPVGDSSPPAVEVPLVAEIPRTVSTAFAASTTSVSPSEHRMHVSTSLRSSSVTSGSAFTQCLMPALPNARDTARIPSARCTPSQLRTVPPSRTIRLRSAGRLGRWSRDWKMIAPSRLVTMARESPTFATNIRGGSSSTTIAVDPGPGPRPKVWVPGLASTTAASTAAHARLRTPAGSASRPGSSRMTPESVAMR